MEDMTVKFSDHTVSERHFMQTAWNTSLIPQYQRAEFWCSAVCDLELPRTAALSRWRISVEVIAKDLVTRRQSDNEPPAKTLCRASE